MILIGTRDVGPAKYLVAMSKLRFDFCWVADEPAASVFSQAALELTPERSIQEKDISLVITGTSLGDYTSSIDKRFLKFAKNKAIQSIAIVEHWSHPVERFKTIDELVLPDWIFVNDHHVKQSMVAEGISKEKILVVGNPYLESLAEMPKQPYRDCYRRKQIYFISEAISESVKKGDISDPGFDEYAVINSVISILKADEILIIKLHPEESPEKFSKFDNNAQVKVIKECSSEHILNTAHSVIGMESMFLIELSISRRDIISFRLNPKFEFIGEKLGCIVCVNNPNDLRSSIDNSMNSVNMLQSYFTNSLDRIKTNINMILR